MSPTPKRVVASVSRPATTPRLTSTGTATRIFDGDNSGFTVTLAGDTWIVEGGTLNLAATGQFKYTRRATPATSGLSYTYESSATLRGT